MGIPARNDVPEPGRLLILNLEGRIRISCARGCGTGCKITRTERNGVGSVIQGCFWTKCRTVQRQRSTRSVRICTPTFVALPAAELCRASTSVCVASIAVPKKATAAFVATVVSQSFSWMLKPTAELVAPACFRLAVRTSPNWTVWSTEPASTAQAALTTSL